MTRMLNIFINLSQWKLTNRYKFLIFNSFWIIFICILLYYRYLNNENYNKIMKQIQKFPHVTRLTNEYEYYEKLFQYCHNSDDIELGVEGPINSSNISLEGTIIIFRHGDRGPLVHLKGISKVNCASGLSKKAKKVLKQYKTYMENLTAIGHMPWVSSPGAFHGFPLLPLHYSQCHLAQLTYSGISQMLSLGNLLSDIYLPRLFNNIPSRMNNFQGFNLIRNSNSVFLNKIFRENLTSDDILIYNTKYRRTFQSVLAFLYSFLPNEIFTKVKITESDSATFCFNDCACPSAEKFLKYTTNLSMENLKLNNNINKVIHALSNQLYEMPNNVIYKDPHLMVNALFVYICHNSPLPCNTKSENNFTSSPDIKCQTLNDVSQLVSYVNQETLLLANNKHFRKASRLKSYGFIKNLVNQILRIVTDKKPKIVLYSGHGTSLKYLLNSLDVKYDLKAIQYASRLIFEIYKIRDKNVKFINRYFFRLLLNGADVTKQVVFCRDYYLSFAKDHFYGCHIENIVKFLHEYYFSLLNSSNFKDACRIL